LVNKKICLNQVSQLSNWLLPF